MAVIDGLLGETEGNCEGFWSEELFHDAMFLGKQSHDCSEYRRLALLLMPTRNCTNSISMHLAVAALLQHLMR